MKRPSSLTSVFQNGGGQKSKTFKILSPSDPIFPIEMLKTNFSKTWDFSTSKKSVSRWLLEFPSSFFANGTRGRLHLLKNVSWRHWDGHPVLNQDLILFPVYRSNSLNLDDKPLVRGRIRSLLLTYRQCRDSNPSHQLTQHSLVQAPAIGCGGAAVQRTTCTPMTWVRLLL